MGGVNLYSPMLEHIKNDISGSYGGAHFIVLYGVSIATFSLMNNPSILLAFKSSFVRNTKA
jgi:hypothetical protein